MQEYAQLPAFCRSQMSPAALNAALLRLQGLSSATRDGAGLSLKVLALPRALCTCRQTAGSAAAAKRNILSSRLTLSRGT